MGFLPLVWQLWAVFLVFVPVGLASAAGCVSGWEWSNNSKNQSPCEVAGYLQGGCLGYDTHELAPLAPDSWYTEPAKGDTICLECSCNTVIYSLYAACTACQNIPTEVWSKWSQNCDATYVAQYPLSIPGGTAIPRWAFLNVTEVGNFDATAAEKAGRDPEAVENFPIALSLSPTSVSETSPSSIRTPTPGSSSGAFVPLLTGGDTSGGNNNPALIIGGVVAGVVGFIILSLLLWSSLRHCSSEGPLFATRRLFSHRTFSTHSESYRPPSESTGDE